MHVETWIIVPYARSTLNGINTKMRTSKWRTAFVQLYRILYRVSHIACYSAMANAMSCIGISMKNKMYSYCVPLFTYRDVFLLRFLEMIFILFFNKMLQYCGGALTNQERKSETRNVKIDLILLLSLFFFVKYFSFSFNNF